MIWRPIPNILLICLLLRLTPVLSNDTVKPLPKQHNPPIACSAAGCPVQDTNHEISEGPDEEEECKKPKKGCLIFRDGDSEFKFGVKLRLPEFFYGKNLRLLNDNNPTDRVLYFRHTLDFLLEYRYGKPATEYDIIYTKMNVRNKGVWGDPESIASTLASPVNELGTSFGRHSHGIPRHILWIRELWIQFSLNDLFNLPFCTHHTLTLGAFPFELGRGIALGAAYQVDASDLGFITEAAVDQYAFGGKLSGDLIKDTLTYDLYGAILDNKAADFNQVNAKIRGQQFHHRNDAARGFGVINYIVAGRLKWIPDLRFDNAKTRIEPYILYNHNPEQQIEFLGDAKSDLVTLGVASESEVGSFEWGFDTAFNFGKQTVFGWDRNTITLENRAGSAVIVNSRVKQMAGEAPTQSSPKALSVPANQKIIELSPQDQSQNGQIIGTNSLGTLINDAERFNDAYDNKYRGYMFVFDMAYTVCKPDLKLNAAFGFASGDANPNKDEEFSGDSDVDGEYEGFIGLQEVYSGTRVKSAFLLSGAGRIPRPLAFPSEETVSNPFSTSVSRFTNIVYVGGGVNWNPSWSCRKWKFNPNVLAYWTDFTTPFFNASVQENSKTQFARNYLGLEINLFAEAELLTDLRLFSVSSFFFPGGHYKDIKGRPLNRDQLNFLKNQDQTGILNNRVPLLGNDASFFFNVGLEYRF